MWGVSSTQLPFLPSVFTITNSCQHSQQVKSARKHASERRLRHFLIGQSWQQLKFVELMSSSLQSMAALLGKKFIVPGAIIQQNKRATYSKNSSERFCRSSRSMQASSRMFGFITKCRNFTSIFKFRTAVIYSTHRIAASQWICRAPARDAGKASSYQLELLVNLLKC